MNRNDLSRHPRRPLAQLAPSKLALGVLVGLLAVGSVNAQSRTAAAAGEAKQSEAADLSSVVVTARKRDERQIDVPIAINSVSGEQMTAMGLTNVVDVIAMTPGAGSVDSGGGFTQVQIRGVSSSLGGNDNGYYLDEIPFTGVTVPWYPDARSFDLDRVEILKGPQGTLFGEGSMGGTVRVITQKPDFNYFNAGVELSGASTQGGSNSWGGKAVVNIPLIDDKLAVRVAMTDESLSGWITDNKTGDKNINEQNVKTGRVKVRFAPTEQWNMDLAYWKYKSDAPGGGNTSLDNMTTNSFYSNDDEWRVGSFVTSYDLGGSQLFYSFADAKLDYLNDGWIDPTTTYRSLIEIGVRTHELRWSSTGERTLDWTVGYYHRDAERNDASSVGGVPPSQSSQTNGAYAVFGEATLKLPNPAWALTAGLRYFTDDVDAVSISTTRTSTLKAKFSSWNPRLNLSYKPADNTTLYASAARGFRSGQLQPITSILLAEANGIDLPATINPDSIWTYEIGAKSLLADGKVMLEGAVFYSDWKGVAVRVPITSQINGLANSKGTVNKGIEGSVIYMPTDRLTLQFGGSVIDATYVEDVPGTPLNKGTPVYNVPRTNLSSSVAYTWPVGAALKAVARGGVLYTSARETALTQGLPGDALTLVDARIGLESANGWSAFLYGENLTNEDGAINARSLIGASNRFRPRSVGMVLRYNY